ncbi:MAG: exodeoxyribonuclease III [Mariprofundaceae bacterium]|nr:exodeoxyribonuclease III [Mariprofundaceae bacterium]
MTKIITFNVNGIRATTRKGFWRWFADQDADVLCVQELKAHAHQLPEEARPAGYFRYLHCAKKPGYSGVALYTRREPDAVHFGLNAVDDAFDWSMMDAEGRFIQADFGKLRLISVYFPSGSSSPERQSLKMVFLANFLPYVQGLKEAGCDVIICGDVNIAHQNIDLKNWRGNQKNSGFLPDERAWFDQMLDLGIVDVLRALDATRAQYSWWSNRGKARANNVGWRIDYHLCTPHIAGMCSAVDVYTDAWFSDHAPVVATFDAALWQCRE